MTFAHDVPVHWTITVNATASALDDSSAYANFLNTISSDCNAITATNAMVFGSGREDAPIKGIPLDAGGKRSINHFYDPLDTKYGKGLSDIPPDIRYVIATNSFRWGSVSNCFGLQVVEGITSNQWSWPNARGYEWLALTSSNQITRSNNFKYMSLLTNRVEG